MTHFPQILTPMAVAGEAATYGIFVEVANDDDAPAAQEQTGPAKFEVDAVYTGRFATNYDAVFAHRIVRRTEKSVWVQQVCPGTHKPRGGVERKAIQKHHASGYELVYPMGRYSMCPILGADRKA